MQNNDNHIDRFFRNGLSEYSPTPPPGVWDKVMAGMNKRRSRKRKFLLWTMAGAASLLLAFVSGWLLSEQAFESEMNKQMHSLRAEMQPQIIMHTLEPALTVQLQTGTPQPFLFDPFLLNVKQKGVEFDQKTVSAHDPLHFISAQEYIPAVARLNIARLGLLGHSSELLKPTDRAIIEANLLAINVVEKSESRESVWAVGIKGSPIFREDQPTFGMQKDLFYSEHEPAINNTISTYYKPGISGGVSLEYETGSRISFVSGINYNEIKKGAENVAVAFASHNWLNSLSGFDYLYSGEANSKRSDQSNGNTYIQTSSGMANIALPAGTLLVSASRDEYSLSSMGQNLEYEHSAAYIEIPILVRYKILDKIFGVHLFGGLNTNFLIASNVTLSKQNNVVARGNLEDLRPLTFSSSLGMGLNYKLFDVVNISIEPTLKMYLSTLNAHQAYSDRPYALGIYSGISYNF